jgi:hypothetical protein
MKTTIVITAIILQGLTLQAQKYFTRDGDIQFLSSAPMEEITATNSKATSVLDVETGAVEWAVLISAFKFKKALMEEHFNENYMESTKFPKSMFKGTIADIASIDLSTDGTYTTTVDGELEIRGIKKSVSSKITFTVTDGQVNGTCQFAVLVADFDIAIPNLVKDNIAKEVEISVNANYQLL